TVSMRGKEEAHDYRYFPDPDLPPLAFDAKRIEALRQALPELPEAKRARWQKDLGLTEYDAGVLSAHPEVAKYFEAAAEALAKRADKMKASEAGKKVGNFIQSEVLRHVSTDGLSATFPVGPSAVAGLLAVVEDGTINGKIAKKVFATMVDTGKSARAIIDEGGFAQVTDKGAIEDEVRRVLEANPSQVQQYKGGKTGVLGFFVGQVMKATQGAANPKMVNETLKRLLDAP
ncbi:MAG: Asp-tRNA(Asn)/Glu-tRNA(Gln) amidotransferase GatCAB subunit B, partial [Myxococcales bacterium]|nr:Asp-tRNA(Asn)/Glu-tRNA(Gln) amidotransferase GatCAB subunit B [Myxococcales bacterium]